MSRKRVVRKLPELTTVRPSTFLPQDDHARELADCLRTIARQSQQKDEQPFYSMRDVAKHFRVSVPTVARAYQLLEDDGLLTRIRGSRTMLAGHLAQAHHPVRGVVGIAIALPVFLYGHSTRTLYVRLEEELRRHRFVADFIFYQMHEELRHPAELAQRLLEHRLDVVLWFAPGKSAVPAMQRLQDAGVQLVTLSDGKARYPREQYFLDVESGIAKGLAEWKADGVNLVAIAAPIDDAQAERSIETAVRLVESRRLRCEVIQVEDAATARRLRQLASKTKVGVILQPHYWYESLCDQFPQVMERLFSHCRVMLAQDALAHGFFRNKHVFADVVTHPFDEMARRIAQDIGSGRIATTERLATFHSVWVPRVDLGSVAKET